MRWNSYSQSRANEIWEKDCFVLDLYLVDGQKKTKAEAFLAWLNIWCCWDECMRWWHHRNVAVRVPNEIRQVEESWKKSRIDKMIAATSSGGWYGSY